MGLVGFGRMGSGARRLVKIMEWNEAANLDLTCLLEAA